MPEPTRQHFAGELARMEAHALAFHVGRPLDIFVEWDRLAAQIDRPEPRYVVMPLARLAECGEHVPLDRFEMALLLELIAELRRAPVLPDDGVVDRTAGAALPDDGGLALVGDADGRHVRGREAGAAQRLRGHRAL